jgi:hypothetical protein
MTIHNNNRKTLNIYYEISISIKFLLLLNNAQLDLCLDPLNSGLCNLKIKSWFFNSRIGECMPLFYSGCGGNDNNFPNRGQCENACDFSTNPYRNARNFSSK